MPGAVPALQGEHSALCPQKSLLGQWQGFQGSFLEQKGEAKPPTEPPGAVKAPNLPSDAPGGVDLPPLGAEAPHKVPAGSHPCVLSGDAWSWGQTRPSCVENSRCGFICCFTTDQGICRRIFLGRGCVCVQDLPRGEALGCRTQGGRGQGDTPRGGCGDPACSGGAWGGLGPLLGSFVGLV